MKKAIIILAVLSIFVVLTVGPASAASMKAYKSNIFTILGISADHTYHCAYSSGYNCWSWTGGQSGGSYISYSYGYGNYSLSRCTSTNWGCRFVYAVQGVCHQEANRGLYTSGKTIARGGVGGYWLTGPVFGTYGGGWWVCRVIFC